MDHIKEFFSGKLTAIHMKAASFMEFQKIRTYIITLNREIRELETEVGRKIYEHWSETGCIGGEEENPVLEHLQQIEQKQEAVKEQQEMEAALHRKMKEVLGDKLVGKEAVIYCPHCGKTAKKTVNFCAKCGTKLL